MKVEKIIPKKPGPVAEWRGKSVGPIPRKGKTTRRKMKYRGRDPSRPLEECKRINVTEGRWNKEN